MYVTIKDFPHFEINKDGEIRSKQTGKIKKQAIIRQYYYCDMKHKDKRLNARVHRLVAKAFIPNPDNLPEVNHIDFDKLNNHVSNLEWIDKSGNLKHKTKMQKQLGIYKKPKGNRKYKDGLIIKIKELREKGLMFREIKKITKVPMSTLIHVCLGSRRSV